ncbi:MAG: hypothetical protein AAFN70_09285, partial [Planctomycetota bacterium]
QAAQSIHLNTVNRSVGGPVDYFRYEMLADNAARVTVPTNADFPVNAAGLPVDLDNQAFPPTIGYLNREWGVPQSNTAGTLHVGQPNNTYMIPTPWLNRPYTSPREVMMVPATATSRLSMEMDPGTELADNAGVTVESYTRHQHLLGFDAAYGAFDAADHAVPGTDAASLSTIRDQAVAGRPPFESFFDMVSTGPVFADEMRWFDPRSTTLPTNASVTTDAGSGNRFRGDIFTRITETLQPPFNHIAIRQSGRINPNTTPDYLVTNGPAVNLDSYEFPDDPTDTARSMDAANPRSNEVLFNNGATTVPAGGTVASVAPPAQFNGEGSVYAALAFGQSSFQEYGNEVGIRTRNPGLGLNSYETTQDTPYGYGFKSFIESRTGYTSPPANPGTIDLGNPFLHHQFPTRFAGVFAPGTAALTPSVLRFMRTKYEDNQRYNEIAEGFAPRRVRRPYDMGVMRTHPDFDHRDTPAGETNGQYVLESESAANVGRTLQSKLSGAALFDRPLAELHRDNRLLDRNPMMRFKNTMRMENLVTPHSNVFMVRMTIGFFRYNPATGELGTEYGVEDGNVQRVRASAVIDRTTPVAFEEGVPHNVNDSIILQRVLE